MTQFQPTINFRPSNTGHYDMIALSKPITMVLSTIPPPNPPTSSTIPQSPLHMLKITELKFNWQLKP